MFLRLRRWLRSQRLLLVSSTRRVRKMEVVANGAIGLKGQKKLEIVATGKTDLKGQKSEVVATGETDLQGQKMEVLATGETDLEAREEIAGHVLLAWRDLRKWERLLCWKEESGAQQCEVFSPL